ncbi:MAG: BamA/TamA family outer membrane protein [Gemmatimonadota bacterium]|nr:MAG: BamA/TamA family outer membrane protein [Gemmatimonadota bacterium]
MLRERVFQRIVLIVCVFCVPLGHSIEAQQEARIGRYENGLVGSDQPTTLAASSGFISSFMFPFSAAKRIVKLSKIRYNRVEGIFLGVSPPKLAKADFEVFGYLGYGFESSKWRYEVGLKRSWFWMNRLEIGAAHYDLTDTQDRWIVSGLENTLAALLFREDFMDYYRRKGWRFFASQNISEVYKLGLEFRSDRYEGMHKRTDWSIFGGDKKFRHNPSIDEGKMESLVATAEVDMMGYRQGWIFRGEYEKAGDPFGGDFDFQRLWLQSKRYQRTFGNQQAVIRVMAGFHKRTWPDIVPEQKRFDLGGIESLRGFPFKVFTGDRMVLGNFYYLFGGDILGRSNISIVRTLQLILFVDTGATFNRNKNLQLRDLNTDGGVALADLENSFRINFAKRLDRWKNSIEITVRLMRKF